MWYDEQVRLKKGTVKRLHVSQPNIRANRKDGGTRPVLSISTSSGTFHGDLIEIRGPSKLIYRPDRPISCGARVWVETRAEVIVDE